MNDYQKFIAISRYARWMDDAGRRETWEETVRRYVDYIRQQLGDNFRYYCEGNVHKYIHRYDYKNQIADLKIQDLKKGKWYLDRLIEELESET